MSIDKLLVHGPAAMVNDCHVVCPEDLFAGDNEGEFFQQVVHSFLDVFVIFKLRVRGFLKRKDSVTISDDKSTRCG